MALGLPSQQSMSPISRAARWKEKPAGLQPRRHHTEDASVLFEDGLRFTVLAVGARTASLHLVFNEALPELDISAAAASTSPGSACP